MLGMRIDLHSGGRRPWVVKQALRFLAWQEGVQPGPPLVFSYRPDLVPGRLAKYMVRGTSSRNPWGKGNAEMFAAFVSRLNDCHF